MNQFAIVAIVMTGLAVAIVVWPLLRDGAGAPITALVLGLTFPAAVLVIYLSVSNHDWSAPVPATRSVAGDPVNSMAPDLQDAVRSLEDRLRAQPDDADGWLLLGRSYAQLQNVSESRRAFRQALALEPSNEAKLGVAEADILLDRNNLSRDAGRLVEEVLAIEPQNPKALFYGGMVAMTRNDVDTFRERWQLLLTMSPPDSIRAVIESQLEHVGVGAGSAPPVATEQGINVNISVTDNLVDRVGPGAILFLVAREPDRPGPPVAVVRHDASALPATLKISDSNAMMAGRPLSSLARVQLIARITNSGDPAAQPGDLFGEAAWAGDTGEGVSITVDRIVE